MGKVKNSSEKQNNKQAIKWAEVNKKKKRKKRKCKLQWCSSKLLKLNALLNQGKVKVQHNDSIYFWKYIREYYNNNYFVLD